MVSDWGSYVEMESYWGEGVIGEEIVGVSLVWRFEVMIDGHCWVSLGVGGHDWVKAGVVGRCLVMCVVVGHFVEVVEGGQMESLMSGQEPV